MSDRSQLLLKSYTKYYTVIIHGDTFHCFDSPIRWRVNVAVPDVQQDGDTAATFASGEICSNETKHDVGKP